MKKRILQRINCLHCGKEFETLYYVDEGMAENVYCPNCIENGDTTPMKIEFFWNGSIAGAVHSMIVNGKEIFVDGVNTPEEEAKKYYLKN